MLARRSFIALVFALSACAPTIEEVPPAVVVEPPPPPPRDAHLRAAEVVGAKITAMVYVERVRGHALAPRIAKMDAWSGVLEGTGIDPLRDLDRAFVAGRNLTDQSGAIAVAQHHVAPETIAVALKGMVEKSGSEGAWLDEYPFPAARVVVRGRKSVVLAPTDELLVVTSERYAAFVRDWTSSGGLPDPIGTEAVVADVVQPSETLVAPRVPPIPPTISRAHATITFLANGDAEVSIDGESGDPDQAAADAAALTEAIDDATTMKISVIKIRAFDPIVFRADGDHVKADRRVTKQELDSLLGLAEMLSN
jgi:hypothetical protein